MRQASRRSERSFRPSLQTLEHRDVPSGFRTAAPSYLVPSAPVVQITPLLTVGDTVADQYAATAAVPDYRMVGIPDGMGAYDNGDGTFTVLMNHELPANTGVVRDHGQRGSFVSKWVISKRTLNVLEGDDLIKSVVLSPTSTNQNPVLSRLCSADLPELTAFFNAATGRGSRDRIFMNGEEAGAEGRAFGTVVSTGVAYELEELGKWSWENSVTSPYPQDSTIVMGTDDSTVNGQVYVWVGAKQQTGSEIEKAGLVNYTPGAGGLFAVKVNSGPQEELLSTAYSGRFSLVSQGDQTGVSGATLDATGVATGATEFLRPEDGHWDPNNPSDFYFVTTSSFGGSSRLYRLRFDDITNPLAGGTITAVIDGGQPTSPVEMLDNMTVDAYGQVLLQEDVGNNVRLGKVWQYDLAAGALTEVAQHNPDLFLAASPNYLGTQDEESSGIIDLSGILGRGYYLANVQAHYPIPGELVEGGQLLVVNTNLPRAVQGGGGRVTVSGTAGDDTLRVTRSGRRLTVSAGADRLGTFDAREVKSIVIDAAAGNDQVRIGANVRADILVSAGAGDDLVVGGGGRNFLIGGGGRDRLVGGAVGDALVLGDVADQSALDGAFLAWTGRGGYQARVAGVTAALGGAVADDASDLVSGLGGLDLFFASGGDSTDRRAAERGW
ncbi:MAG TPA: hypothetical protein VM597_36740 [Gemmataceae bacterium]|nr:hypothetical protein [Gemmataceae bacterium]